MGFKSKEKQAEYMQLWRQNNKEKITHDHKNWRDANSEKIKIYNYNAYAKNTKERLLKNKLYKLNNANKVKNKNKKYYENNRTIIINKNKEYRQKIENYNKIYYEKLKQNKNNKSVQILGCTIEEFKLHIEKQFEPWMNWENKSKATFELEKTWNLDHIISLGNARTIEEKILLNHYTNLRPLDAIINCREGCRKVSHNILDAYIAQVKNIINGVLPMP
jgi:hypothetical protein